jgi:hypothetical protein
LAGDAFRASTAAVIEVHGAVRDAGRNLVDRMAATRERVLSAARDYADTEDCSACSLRNVRQAREIA